jgi:hypothetical protein
MKSENVHRNNRNLQNTKRESITQLVGADRETSLPGDQSLVHVEFSDFYYPDDVRLPRESYMISYGSIILTFLHSPAKFDTCLVVANALSARFAHRTLDALRIR